MSYRTQETGQEVVLAPAGKPLASVIWLHGLGADGHDFVPIVPELRLPPESAVRFVFPHAPMRPVTINNGMRMRAWYDIVSLSAAGPPDEAGIRASAALVERLIAREVELGVAPGAHRDCRLLAGRGDRVARGAPACRAAGGHPGAVYVPAAS